METISNNHIILPWLKKKEKRLKTALCRLCITHKLCWCLIVALFVFYFLHLQNILWVGLLKTFGNKMIYFDLTSVLSVILIFGNNILATSIFCLIVSQMFKCISEFSHVFCLSLHFIHVNVRCHGDRTITPSHLATSQI